MKIKSYFVDSISSAIDRARAELGADAVLISSRQTNRELNDLGTYEVVFGVHEEKSAAVRTAKPSAIATTLPSGETGPDRILQELLSLRKEIERFREQADELPFSAPKERPACRLSFLQDYLVAQGFSHETACDLTASVEQKLPQHARGGTAVADSGATFSRELAGAMLLEEISSRFDTAPVLGKPDAQAATVMLVGTPGVGKTATLMKLALRYGLKLRRPTHLLSLDTLRLGGWEQMSAFSRISGLDFEALQHVSLLERAVADRVGRGLTLIDTPGFSPASEAEGEELARLTARLDIDVHLVLPATVSFAAARRTFQNFEKFRPKKLLLTHTDQMEQSGSLLDMSMRSRLPLSFLCCGQEIPEDIREADKPVMIDAIGSPFRAVSVTA